MLRRALGGAQSCRVRVPLGTRCVCTTRGMAGAKGLGSGGGGGGEAWEMPMDATKGNAGVGPGTKGVGGKMGRPRINGRTKRCRTVEGPSMKLNPIARRHGHLDCALPPPPPLPLREQRPCQSHTRCCVRNFWNMGRARAFRCTRRGRSSPMAWGPSNVAFLVINEDQVVAVIWGGGL